MTNAVTLEMSGSHIAIITLNRPEAANSFSHQLMDDLEVLIHEVKQNDAIRCVIVTGSGEKSFCAGADLKERSTMTQQQVVQTVHRIGEVVNKVESIPCPVIAAINGAAFGGGLELSLACDIRYASETSKMGLTEVSLGIIPGAGGTQRLPRLIGLGKAKELIFSAKRIDAMEASTLGLVEQVVPQQTLMEQALQQAERIAANAPIALKQAKHAIQQGYEVDLHSGLAIEWMCYQTTIPTKDRLEGLEAFKEKRKANFRGE
ncbi:enoyl-CoA hydratase [Pontibacillus yanchengensis]|uniref:Enoyl-CoA hydratase n=2 Tax=Pontibacillus yanchengensis TaxID=462910 RepID=A0ACC7VAN5_9BACI|nr:enoyl-CoA hydratase [Pontibacillus yanchengensis]MYL32952.1 enoyl-CoA hydratase [Pontibacillus yanchengensis]MYL51861.1 enoyl-CoA hydratase [Pontibacillus yanchengensis]